MSAQPPPRRPAAPPATEEAPTVAGTPPRAPRAPAYSAPAAPPAYDERVSPAYGAPPLYGEPIPPEDPRWWDRGWWSEALVALAALAIGFVVGLLVGESSASKTVTSERGGAARTVTVKGPTHTTTVNHVVVHTRTHTVTTAAPSEGGGGGGGEGASGPGKTYTGSGNSRVGTLTIARESTIHWRSSGGLSITNSSEDERSLAFNSGASSGEGPVEPGTYHQVTVNAPGAWTMTISPG